ncbi:hypothetical protein TNCV_294631 [Trichonephila clavipes]|nr:hypothetical protein TNCV_294631 [Trichonephila clavipes]
MKTVSFDKVKRCVRILRKDDFVREGKAMSQHPKQKQSPKTRGSAHGARGTSRNLTLDGVNLVIQLDPMHLKQPWLDILKERKHEHSRRRASISSVYIIGRTKFPTLPQGFRIPEVPISSSHHSI